MAKKTKNPQYAVYQSKGNYAANKKAKIERHLKKHPEDKQSVQALSNVKLYSRKKPVNKLGWIKESLRASTVYIPFVNGKGSVIGVRSPEQLENLKRLPNIAQAIPLTKESATKLAQIFAFTRFI